ncbi:MAG TPA: hypothetical protein VND90_08395 [Terracidiphilus sp.]|nr:hypothetical protein [Terracidiphilus sp.]
MSDQQRTHVYQNALTDAQSELEEILGEFNELAGCKHRLEHVIDVLGPLLHFVQADAASQAAPAEEYPQLTPRTFQPLFANETPQQVQNFTETANFQIAQTEVAHEEVPVAPAVLAETSQPEQEVVLQQNETREPVLQPVAAGDRLEQRINFALNFALLS